MRLYFSLYQYPELAKLPKEERNAIVIGFYKTHAKQMQLTIIPIILLCALLLPFLKDLSQFVFSADHFFLRALIAGAFGMAASIIASPFITTFYLRKYFIAYLASQEASTTE